MIKKTCLVGLVLSAALISAGCSTTKATSHASRNYIESFKPSIEHQPILMTKEWTQTNIGHHTYTSKPMGGQIAQVADSGDIRLIDVPSGETILHLKTKHQFAAQPAISKQYILALTKQGHLLAFNRQSGALLWDKKVYTAASSAPLISEKHNRVWVLPQDGRLQAFELDDGAALWTLDIPAHPALTLHLPSEPLLVKDTLYVGGRDGQLRALTALEGKILWHRPVGIPKGRSDLQRMVDIIAVPTVEKNHVFVVSYQGKLMSLSLNNTIDWEHELSGISEMVVHEESVYITDTNGIVWAFDKHTGLVRWRQEAFEGHRVTAPIIVDQQVLVADEKGYMHWLETKQGKWIHTDRVMSKPFRSLQAVGDNQLLAFDDIGHVTLYRW